LCAPPRDAYDAIEGAERLAIGAVFIGAVDAPIGAADAIDAEPAAAA